MIRQLGFTRVHDIHISLAAFGVLNSFQRKKGTIPICQTLQLSAVASGECVRAVLKAKADVFSKALYMTVKMLGRTVCPVIVESSGHFISDSSLWSSLRAVDVPHLQGYKAFAVILPL